jgi:hypothetical protein
MLRLRIPLWSRLTRLQRILFAAVALIVVLFVVAVSAGASGQRDLSRPPGFITWLGGVFGGPDPVAPTDVNGDCVPGQGLPADRRLTIHSSCVLHVRAAGADLRQLKIHTEGAMSVEAPAPRGDTTVVKQLGAQDDVSVAVNSGGADITITCAASSCAVTVS